MRFSFRLPRRYPRPAGTMSIFDPTFAAHRAAISRRFSTAETNINLSPAPLVRGRPLRIKQDPDTSFSGTAPQAFAQSTLVVATIGMLSGHPSTPRLRRDESAGHVHPEPSRRLRFQRR